MKQYLFDGYDPSLRDQLGPGAIVVTGRNFGLGSSREHVVQALEGLGRAARWSARASPASSAATASTSGLPIFEAPEAAEAAQPGSRIRIDTEAGEIVVDGRTFTTPPVAELVAELQAAGGLVPWTKERAR